MRGRVRSRRNRGLLRTPGLGRAGSWLHMQKPEQKCHETSSRVGCQVCAMLPGEGCCCPGRDLGRSGWWTDPEQCRMHEGAVPGHAMPWRGDTARSPRKLGHGTHSGGTYGVSPSPSGYNPSPGPLSTYSHGITPCTCPGQLSPHTPSGSPCGTWLPSGRSAGQSSSAGWGRTWGESQGTRMRLSSLSSTQAVSAAGGQGCEQTFTPQMPGVSQVPSPALARDNLLFPRQRQVSGVARPRAHSQEAARTWTSCLA